MGLRRDVQAQFFRNAEEYNYKCPSRHTKIQWVVGITVSRIGCQVLLVRCHCTTCQQ